MPEDYLDQSPDGEVRATELVMNLVRTTDEIYARIGRLLRPLGVSQAGGLVLGLLKDNGAMQPSELGDRLIVTRATVTGVLNSLETQGYVTRTEHPTDGRSLLVGLTAEGKRAIAKIRPMIHEAERDWLAGLSDIEKRRLIELLHKTQDSLNASPES